MRYIARKTIGLALLSLCIFECKPLSEQVIDPEAGLNGSFETVREGIPVNWLLYTSKTVPLGRFRIILDTLNTLGGNYSLQFDVQECSSEGGNKSPGIATQIEAIPGQEYKLSFWVMNDQSQFRVRAGGVSPKTGAVKTLVHSHESIPEWKYYEYSIIIPKEFNQLRFELNVLTPGTFWIDDVRVEAI